jgi:hypothetical protein
VFWEFSKTVPWNMWDDVKRESMSDANGMYWQEERTHFWGYDASSTQDMFDELLVMNLEPKKFIPGIEINTCKSEGRSFRGQLPEEEKDTDERGRQIRKRAHGLGSSEFALGEVVSTQGAINVVKISEWKDSHTSRFASKFA